MSMMKTAAVAGVPFSSNVGDGVISDCIELLLVNYCGFESINKIDIAGRENYSSHSVNHRLRLIGLFQYFPKLLRGLIVFVFVALMYFLKNRKEWSKIIRDSDVLIVGGGQLLSDVDLNFPSKIFFICSVARKYNKPIVFQSCGVANNWSFFGKILLKKSLLLGVSKITVRDRYSRNVLIRYLGPACKVDIIYDPALVVGKFRSRKNNYLSKKIIGVGVASPYALSYASVGNFVDKENWNSYFHELINMVRSHGFDVLLFTNGAPEDEQYLTGLLNGFNCVGVKRAPRPLSGDDLIDTISGIDLFVGHRLHSSIVSFALGIPSIGLGWDRKVKDFYDLVGLGSFFAVNPADALEIVGVELSNLYSIQKESNFSHKSARYFSDDLINDFSVCYDELRGTL